MKKIALDIDFLNISTKKDIFDFFKEKLNFPSYFSYNYDSFEECLEEAKNKYQITINIINVDKSKLIIEDKNIFFDICENLIKNKEFN